MDNFHYFGLFLDTNTKNKLMNILTDNIDYNIALNVADKIFIDYCSDKGAIVYFKREELAQQAIELLGEETIKQALSHNY